MTGNHDYVIRGGADGRERLKILARVMQPTTEALFDRLNIERNMRILDIGCGGGDVTTILAERVGPGGHVVGYDLDADKIALAREEAQSASIANVSYEVASVDDFPRDAKFEVAYARFLLTHLADPVNALQRIAGTVRVGGMVIVEDVDFRGHFCHPPSAAFDRYVDWYQQVVRLRGADPDIGPRIPEMFLQIGLESVSTGIVQPSGLTGEVKQIASLTLANIADSLVQENIATHDEVEQALAELEVYAADNSTLMSLPRIVQTWGIRVG